jgi:hypothetical protein
MYFIVSSCSEWSRMRRTGGDEIDSDQPIAICEHLRMSDGAELRASDQERELAASQLREHYAAGRLSEDELNDRLDAVYGAKTAGDLRAHLADLPALPPAVADRRAEVAERRAELQRELLQQTWLADAIGTGAASATSCTADALGDARRSCASPLAPRRARSQPRFTNGRPRASRRPRRRAAPRGTPA